MMNLAGTDSSVSGGYSGEVTPDPIPNSEVKLASANGTARVTLWESRTPPDLSWNPPTHVGGFFFCRKKSLSGLYLEKIYK